MIPYVDYDYYVNDFEGNLIPKNSFNKTVKEASRKINYFTSNKIVNVNSDVKDATCSIAELLYNQEQLKTKLFSSDNASQKVSETVGPWSVSYANNYQYQDKQIKTDKELNNSIYKICKEYLDEELLFRGV